MWNILYFAGRSRYYLLPLFNNCRYYLLPSRRPALCFLSFLTLKNPSYIETEKKSPHFFNSFHAKNNKKGG